MQDDVSLPVLQLITDEVATVGGGDVGSKGNNAGDRFDRDEIDAYGAGCLGNASGGRRLAHVPTITLLTGMNLLATWSQPPGAAHRSIQHLAGSRKEYFLLSWMSLNAERAR